MNRYPAQNLELGFLEQELVKRNGNKLSDFKISENKWETEVLNFPAAKKFIYTVNVLDAKQATRDGLKPGKIVNLRA